MAKDRGDEPDDRNLDPIDRPRPGAAPGTRPSKSKPPEMDPKLNNPDATPGTGMLPSLSEEEEPNVQPSS